MRARVHACLHAVQRLDACAHSAYNRTVYSRCTTCTERLGAACTRRVREPLRAIIMAAVDTPSLSPVSNASLDRTNERTLAAPFARHHYIFRGEKERAHERRTRPEIRTHATRRVEYPALSFQMGEGGRGGREERVRLWVNPVTVQSNFFLLSLNIPPASIRYFVTDTLTRESGPPVGGTGLSSLRGKLDWGGRTRILPLVEL